MLRNLIASKITMAIWSIKVFHSRTFICSPPNEDLLEHPTLQASDVTDVSAEFVADPFIICHESRFYMFFEVFDKVSLKGIIGLAVSEDGEKWDYQRIVLKEDFHLSYPHVFQFNQEWYMVPETIGAGKVLLYKAKSFPHEWEMVSVLMEGKYVDPSIFQFNNKWWMFAGTDGKLHLFFSDQMDANWVEHPKSPLVSENFNITRPAGRVILDQNYIYRYTQDGMPYYGSQVRVFKITTLSEQDFQEEEVCQVLLGSERDNDWRKNGMHSIDQLKIADNQWIIAVDGHTFKQRNRLLAKLDYILARLRQN